MKKTILLIACFAFVASSSIFAQHIVNFDFNIDKSGGYTNPALKKVSKRKWVVNMKPTSSKHHFWAQMRGDKTTAIFGKTDVWGGERRVVSNSASSSSTGNKESYKLQIGRRAGLFDNGKIRSIGSWSPDEK